MNKGEAQTDIRLQCKEVLKSRRERSRAAHLVADRLVLEPRLVQNLLQLLVVEVGHPNGLGQPCVLTLLQGLGGRGGEQSFEMSDRPRINDGKKSVKSVSCQKLTLILRKKKGEEGHDTRRRINHLLLRKPWRRQSHGMKEMPI